MQYGRSDIREGLPVYSRDGQKLGKVVRLAADEFEIEKGLFFPREYLASYREISRIDQDAIWLSWSKEEFEAARTADIGHAEGTTLRGEEARMPLKEEELVVDKQRREAGEVRLRKEVSTEERQVSVPVTREDVRIERVPASGTTRETAAGEAFREEETRVPLYEEEVEIRKRPVVREEVRVTKEAHTEDRPIRETVRKEEVEIDRDSSTSRSGHTYEDDFRHP